jgi:hypothetical protein
VVFIVLDKEIPSCGRIILRAHLTLVSGLDEKNAIVCSGKIRRQRATTRSRTYYNVVIMRLFQCKCTREDTPNEELEADKKMPKTATALTEKGSMSHSCQSMAALSRILDGGSTDTYFVVKNKGSQPLVDPSIYRDAVPDVLDTCDISWERCGRS